MHKWVDHTGKKFNHLTAVEYKKPGKWKCFCECGNTTIVATRNMVKGNTKSCGCLKDYRTAGPKKQLFRGSYPHDLTGVVFGRLTALEPGLRDGEYQYWECRCGCGKLATVLRNNLITGNTKSCGCLRCELSKKQVTSEVREETA